MIPTIELEGSSELTNRLTSVGSTRALSGVAASEVIRGIRERTAQGIDANGKKFKGYTNAYKKRRALKGLKTDVVNLRVKPSDSLLDTLGEQSLEISVSDSKKPQAEGLTKKRRFIATNAQDARNIEDRLQREFERMLS